MWQCDACCCISKCGHRIGGVSFAFGLTVLTIAYSLGHISGAHLNPAVTIGLWAGGRVDPKTVLPYIISQVLGAIAAAGVLYIIVTGNGSSIGDFAANGYADHSPGKYSMNAAMVTEFVMTFMFLIIILGSTDEKALKVLRESPLAWRLHSSIL